jgi:hypothetical protein
VSNLYPRARLLWSSTAAGVGVTLAAAGNSGGWEGNGPGDWPPQVDFEASIDLRQILDVALYVNVGGVVGTPAFVVNLDVYDDQGNLFPAVLSTASLAAAGQKTAQGGLHGYGATSAGAYLILPEWGRVSWSGLTGGAEVTGTEIALYGR